MPNVGVVLKEEVARLSRKEVRRQLAGIKKLSSQYRRHIAALRWQVATLERRLTILQSRPPAAGAQSATQRDGPRTRFVAKGLHSHRARLGLSAAEYGRLVGVTAQTIYSWESKASTPRAAQRAALATLRSLTKRSARARLEALPAAKPARSRAK